MDRIPIEAVLDRIEQRAGELGLSALQVSIRATGKPDAVRDIKRGKWPSAARLAAIEEVLQLPPGELVRVASASGDWVLEEDWKRRGTTAPAAAADSSRVPLLGTAEGGTVHFPGNTEMATMHTGEAIDHLRRPPALANRRRAYAIEHVGVSMMPRYEPGDLHFVDPDAQPRIGDDVIIQLRAAVGDDERVTGGLVKRLVRRTATHLVVEQYNPPEIFEIDNSRIKAVHRIVPVRELYSF